MMINAAPGFFGKVRSHGDFVARRLPPLVASRWDVWLQACMLASSDALAAAWLPAYLNSPIWRFALPCGVVGSAAWAGLLMPSVDRVGRHFPLMLGAAVEPPACVLAMLNQGQPWYDALEVLALSALQDDFRFDHFDAALAAQPGLVLTGVHADHGRAGNPSAGAAGQPGGERLDGPGLVQA